MDKGETETGRQLTLQSANILFYTRLSPLVIIVGRIMNRRSMVIDVDTNISAAERQQALKTRSRAEEGKR